MHVYQLRCETHVRDSIYKLARCTKGRKPVPEQWSALQPTSRKSLTWCFGAHLCWECLNRHAFLSAHCPATEPWGMSPGCLLSIHKQLCCFCLNQQLAAALPGVPDLPNVCISALQISWCFQRKLVSHAYCWEKCSWILLSPAVLEEGILYLPTWRKQPSFLSSCKSFWSTWGAKVVIATMLSVWQHLHPVVPGSCSFSLSPLPCQVSCPRVVYVHWCSVLKLMLSCFASRKLLQIATNQQR